jgi:hypothetical protein
MRIAMSSGVLSAPIGSLPYAFEKRQNRPPERREQYSPGQRPGNNGQTPPSPEGAAHWHTNGNLRQGEDEWGVGLFRPFRAWDNLATVFPGRCPGLYYPRPSGGYQHRYPDVFKVQRGTARFMTPSRWRGRGRASVLDCGCRLPLSNLVNGTGNSETPHWPNNLT